MCGHTEHRAIGMPEDHMAATGLTSHEAVGFRHRLKAFDLPIPRIGLHASERLRGFRHRCMILLVIPLCKHMMPRLTTTLSGGRRAESPARWPF